MYQFSNCCPVSIKRPICTICKPQTTPQDSKTTNGISQACSQNHHIESTPFFHKTDQSDTNLDSENDGKAIPNFQQSSICIETKTDITNKKTYQKTFI
ncbi:unnamed protein product [Ambrosiozyma monospora]|uniref:Unnamed protein product n=1 Tax=Ambrosiozyma monospora TaxID=43982 RepID=A0ACB5T3K9_AMBMO|nr:unnamed protein product [Ambrosiozyma monospora]